MTRKVMRISTPTLPLLTPGGTVVSNSEKAEALAKSLGGQFQALNNPSEPEVIQIVHEALRA